MDDHVVLVGMMGTGKTTVGRLVAARLGRPMIDSDEQVEARTGRTVAEIFEREGEAAYRVLEAEALTAALASDEPAVVAAAGGTVLDPGNRRRLREAGHVVWLRADPEVLERRVRSGDHRPLLGDDPRSLLARLAEEREHLYREVADTVVEVGAIGPEEAAARIVEAVT